MVSNNMLPLFSYYRRGLHPGLSLLPAYIQFFRYHIIAKEASLWLQPLACHEFLEVRITRISPATTMVGVKGKEKKTGIRYDEILFFFLNFIWHLIYTLSIFPRFQSPYHDEEATLKSI